MTDPNLIAILLGAGIGFLMAITGAGGAILSLPLLMYFFNMEIQDAASVALVAIFIAAGSAALIGLKQGIVRYKAAALLAVMGVLMAPLGVYVAHSVTVFLVAPVIHALAILCRYSSTRSCKEKQSCAG